jgi:hypothetical protein
MPLPSPFRKATLLTHILCSVGWIGAVAAFLVLALVGLYSSKVMEMRAVYMAMEPMTIWLIVPLAFLSLITGLVQALSTSWGLFRHYWIVFKLLINLLSLPILLMHTQIIHRVAGTAAANALSAADLHEDRLQLVVASGAALVALIVAALLSVYKPKGRIRQS